MLLEVNRAQHLIIDRPPFEEIERWARICDAIPTCVLTDTDLAWWSSRLPASTLVRAFNPGYFNEVAGNIRDALTELDAQPHDSLYLSFAPLNIGEAVGTRIGTILKSDGVGQTLPDLFIQDYDDLEAAMIDLAKGRPHGYINEQFSMRYGYGDHPAATGHMTFQPFLRDREALEPAIAHNLEIVVAGRYFPNIESRHEKHQPSLRLLHAKKGDKRGVPLVEAFAHTIGLVARNRTDIGIVTRIPPRPGKPDNIGTFLQTSTALADKDLKSDLSRLVNLAALRCVKDYGKQKKTGNYAKRVDNVRDAFVADANAVRGKRVLLVDDVLTSGATIVEATRCLYASGATAITACPIAINQSEINYDPVYELACPREGCDGTMRIRFAREKSGAFWGCTKWQPNNAGCNHKMKFADGLAAANRLTRRDDIITFGEIIF